MHHWLASKLNDHTQVLANQLTSTWSVIRPRQQQLVLAKSDSLVPVPPQAKPVPMATPTPLPGFPQLVPPREKFLSSETELRLLLFWDPVGLNICSEYVVIIEIRRRDPFSLFNRIPLPQDQKICVVAAGSLNSIATTRSSRRRNTSAGLCRQALRLWEPTALCSVAIA